MPEAGDAVEREAAWFQAIEEYFVSRRGDPLVLSNADWTLMRRWRSAGVPLRVALRGIADALDAHAHSWARDRKVGSLRYCADEVERAFERWQRALAGGSDESPEQALPALAVRLEASLAGLPERLAAVARGIVADLAGVHPPGAGLEAWLREREDALLAGARAELGPGASQALEEEVDADLGPYRGRLPARILAQVRSESLRRRALESYGLPRLSLFEA